MLTKLDAFGPVARLFSFILGALCFAVPAAAQTEDWPLFAEPVAAAPAPVGGYANGCILGAQALPAEGVGYQVIRLSRNRFWGHPNLVAMIEDLGRAMADLGHPPMLVGDLAMPRGGPFAYGHRSHQTGLDADIWLRLDLPDLPRSAREGLDSVTMVAGDGRSVIPDFGPAQIDMIRLAAQDPRVARIFLNPAIKVALCERVTGDRAWLQRIRPWFGHAAHMHIRLDCPADAPGCIPQNAPPPGDGCGAELMSWFAPPDPNAPAPRPRPDPVLPATCRALAGDIGLPPVPPTRPALGPGAG